MKVQVDVQTTWGQVTSKCEVVVSGDEKVVDVQELIADSQLIPFGKMKLRKDGEVLQLGRTLAQCKIEGNANLELVVECCEEDVVKHMKDLLEMRDLTLDELAMFYCYKYGVSANQALKHTGSERKFDEIIKERSEFVLQNGKVSLVRDDTSLKPLDCAVELEKILDSAGGTMDMTALCTKFIHHFKVSVTSVVGTRPTEFIQSDPRFVLGPRGTVQLKRMVSGNTSEVSSTASKKSPKARLVSPKNPKAESAARKSKADLFGSAVKAKGFINPKAEEPVPKTRWNSENQGKNRTVCTENPQQAGWSSDGSCSGKEDGDEQDRMYRELHQRVSSRAFNSRISTALSCLVDAIKQNAFLNVESILKSGSVGTNTVCDGTTDAALVFFMKGLPHVDHEQWMPPLLRSVAGVLKSSVPQELIGDVKIGTYFITVNIRNLVECKLIFTPAFASYEDTVEALGELGPHARTYFSAAFAREATSFVHRVPSSVKVTIRLLKWWRDQQQWSCDLTTPSNAILELIAIHASSTKPQDQKTAVANCMALLARFNELRIMWNNYYQKSDIWAPLLLQKPLLMDPVNPFVNVADPQDFDARELVEKAASTHFFW